MNIGRDNESALYKTLEKSLQIYSNTKYAEILRDICVVCNKLQINVIFLRVYGHKNKKILLEELSLPERINAEYNIRSKAELRVNVRNDDPTPPGITHDNIACIMDGIKITDLVGESIRNNTRHKDLLYFLYVRGVLKTSAFDLV